MRINKLISVLAVAMLVACPLISLASDKDSNAAQTDSKGFYFEVTVDESDFKNLFTIDFILSMIDCSKGTFASVLSSYLNYLVYNQYDNFRFDTCTVKHGHEFDSVFGKSSHFSEPTSLKFTGVTVTCTVDRNMLDTSLFNINFWSPEMNQYLYNNYKRDLNQGDVIQLKGDLYIEMPWIYDDTYVEVSDGFVVVNEFTNHIEMNHNQKQMNCNCGVDMGLYINNSKLADVKFSHEETKVFDSDTDFLGVEAESVDQHTLVKLKFNRIFEKNDSKLSVSSNTSSKNDEVFEDLTEQTKEYYESIDDCNVTDFQRHFTSSEFNTMVAEEVDFKLTNAIRVNDADIDSEQEAMQKIISYGGKCTIDPAASKKSCDALNMKIMGLYEENNLFPGIILASVTVVTIAFCVFGIVVFGRRE